ncbi:MAG: hypothetical protein D6735_01365 [Acidobacteria bacterium]|nr:MAG: hypothetical protein D6735_01365 [Acidobacteriota bacterium]
MRKNVLLAVILTLISVQVRGQNAEILITFNEAFFDSLLDAVFKQNIEIPLADRGYPNETTNTLLNTSAAKTFIRVSDFPSDPQCRESIRLQRQINNEGKSAVRFRNGKILSTVAFTGSYNPPLIGCVDFAGIADALIELIYSPENQILSAQIRVINVNLSGSGGMGGTIIARLLQGFIDKKVNPIVILDTRRLSFVFPVQNGREVRIKPISMRYEVAEGALNVFVRCAFD